jgi:hypothetical protein
MKRAFFAASLLLLPVAAVANPVTCEYGELSRTIEVVYSAPGQPVPCEVIYDKSAEGSMASLWRANVEAGYCEARAAELIAKLEGFGWRCEAAGTDTGSGTEDNSD